MPVCSIIKMKEYVNNYINKNGREITKTVLMIASATIFFQAVNYFSELLGMILLFAFLTLPQGLVYASLKIVDNRELSAVDDLVYGIKNIKRYFSTYLIYTLFASLIIAVVIILAEILFSNSILIFAGKDFISMVTMYWINVIILIILALLIYIIYDCNYGMFPYLLETCDVRNFKALKRSRQFMKHKKISYLKLYLCFWKEYFLLAVLVLLLAFVLPTMIDIAMIIFILGEAILIKRKLIIYKALFYNNSGLDD